MCGLVGFVDHQRRWRQGDLVRLASRMADTLQARGPDDQDAWADAEAGLALGFRRLAVIDLTPAGRQPMVSADEGAVVVFNGEIYNAQDLRRELEAGGAAFRGRSDTEVVLEACRRWGVERAVPRFVGMFGFAYWDRERQTLSLARDRVGIKPLYYGWSADTCFFGSQPKSFFAHPDWQPRLNPTALAEYLRLNYVPGHLSIYDGLSQVAPGAIVTICFDPADRQTRQPRQNHYWEFRSVARHGVADRFDGCPESAAVQLKTLLRQAVTDRLVADVPVGAFLSGGIDSSTVVAIMKEVAPTQVSTFSIGFTESDFDEAPYARQVAKHLDVNHHELYVGPDTARDLIPNISSWYDEPFADNSAIATYLVSRLARGSVTVALSGDGGDELFGGYPWYRQGQVIGGTLGRLPRFLRRQIGASLRALPVEGWDRGAQLIPSALRPVRAGHRMHKIAEILDLAGPDQLYRYLVSQWADPVAVCPSATPEDDAVWMGSGVRDVPDFAERMLYYDTLGYLPDNILTKVDRASMALGLEVRMPMLDHRVVEFAWRLPMSYRQMGGKPKGLLMRILADYVPTILFERPKQGFEMPIAAWLRGGMRDWAEDLLSERMLRCDGIFAPAVIRQRWQEHLSGQRNWQYSLWNILMFLEWKRAWL